MPIAAIIPKAKKELGFDTNYLDVDSPHLPCMCTFFHFGVLKRRHIFTFVAQADEVQGESLLVKTAQAKLRMHA